MEKQGIWGRREVRVDIGRTGEEERLWSGHIV